MSEPGQGRAGPAAAVQHPAIRRLPIETGRLLMRPLAASDAADVFEYQRRADVIRYIPWPARNREEAAEHTAMRAGSRKLAADGDAVMFACVLVGEPSVSGVGDRVIGDVMLRLSSAASAGLEVGWGFHPDFHGRGYASEAATELLDRLRGGQRAPRARRPRSRNTASAALCTRLGMRFEGTTLESYYDKGEWQGSTTGYGILRSRVGGPARTFAGIDERSAPAYRGAPGVATPPFRRAANAAPGCSAPASASTRTACSREQTLRPFGRHRLVPRNGAGSGAIEGHPDAIPLGNIHTRLCEGHLPVLFDADGTVLDLGRDERLFTEKQKTALAIRDGGCLDPDCTRPPSWTEAHHIDHWQRDNGRTDLADGILLCRRDHLRYHNQGWEVRRKGRHILAHPTTQHRPPADTTAHEIQNPRRHHQPHRPHAAPAAHAPLRRAARYTYSSESGTRSCGMVSRSRTVTAWSSSESKSTVMQNGVPISSWRR